MVWTLTFWLYPLLAIVVSSFILCGAVWVLARGAIAWSHALDETHKARAHGVEADMQRETIEQARAAVDRAVAGGRPPPTPEDIREALLRQRGAFNGEPLEDDYHEVTTSGDVTPDELNEHMQGGEFRQPV